MKRIVTLAVIVAIWAGQAAPAAKSAAALTPAEVAARQERFYRKTGGFITRAGKGQVVLFDAQKKLPHALVEAVAAKFTGSYRTRFVAASAPSFVLAEAADRRVKAQANVAFFLVEDAALPMSLVCLEDRWAMVNLAKLAEGNPSAEALEKRFVREMYRLIKALFTSVVVDRDVSSVIVRGSDLDTAGGSVMAPITVVEIMNGLPAWGFELEQVETYKRACRQGWAPPPTNDVQRAIWNEVKASGR